MARQDVEGVRHMTNVVVYSAIYGNYEATAKPLPPDLPCPAIMFTDRADLATQAERVGWTAALHQSIYDQFIVDPANGDPAVTRPMLAHKWWKTHPIESDQVADKMRLVDQVADVSIWLDGSMQIKVSGPEFVDRCLAALGEDDWSLMRHPWRSCVFEEAVYSSTLIYRYDSAAMMRQHDAYLQAEHPRNWGLFATGHMVRRHTETVHAIGEDWWAHNLAFSHQDQLSLPFLIHKYENCPDERFRPRWNANLPWGELWTLHPHGA
jgi:hypothetical protein